MPYTRSSIGTEGFRVHTRWLEEILHDIIYQTPQEALNPKFEWGPSVVQGFLLNCRAHGFNLYLEGEGSHSNIMDTLMPNSTQSWQSRGLISEVQALL